jgi:hypothetical protein
LRCAAAAALSKEELAGFGPECGLLKLGDGELVLLEEPPLE